MTEYEKGFPLQQARDEHGLWEPDTWIWDDQAVVVHAAGLGLVVLLSCSHAGAINVLKHAQRITGVERVHAFIGGLHLTGGPFEAIIPQTIGALAALQPALVVPGHCTGSRATHDLARQLPAQNVKAKPLVTGRRSYKGSSTPATRLAVVNQHRESNHKTARRTWSIRIPCFVSDWLKTEAVIPKQVGV